MGNFIGGVTDAIGLTDHAGEKRAQAAATEATKGATEMSKESIAFAKEQLDFQKQQYADWDNVYGDIQENLGKYYKDLTPDKLVSLGLENQQKQFQQVQDSIKRDFAQRGLTNAGQEIALTAGNAVQNATAKAAIRTNADAMVNEEKMKFLGLGLGQGTQMLGTISNSASNVTGAYASGVNSRTNIASSYLNSATQLNVQGMRGTADAIGAAATAAAASDRRLKENIKYLGKENGHKIYSFNYKGSKVLYKGVIAQDIIKYMPEAVVFVDGYMHVDYDKLGITMEAI